MGSVHRTVGDLISKKIEHSGQLFKLPCMPERDKLDELSLCEDISQCAAKAILKVEMGALLKRWEGLIEEHGLERVAKAYFAGAERGGE